MFRLLLLPSRNPNLTITQNAAFGVPYHLCDWSMTGGWIKMQLADASAARHVVRKRAISSEIAIRSRVLSYPRTSSCETWRRWVRTRTVVVVSSQRPASPADNDNFVHFSARSKLRGSFSGGARTSFHAFVRHREDFERVPRNATCGGHNALEERLRL